ncbi:hypothetical protein DSS3P8_191 [Roseobacter phage DSS3P8]|nr:hypothetical protein DSS3P8_191 [Roseobacter phage DSS3P8]
MNMFMVEAYLDAKNKYEQHAERMGKAVAKAFAEYSKQKRVVSTAPYARWGSYHIRSFTLGLSKLKLNLYYCGTYGYTEDASLTLPATLVQLAAETGAEEHLREAVAKIIADEGADIARREAQAIAKQKEEQAAREKAELDAALELVRKWEAEKEGK